MPETYRVDCTCGAQLPVQLYEAGTRKQCPSCAAIISVPSTTKLKELSGDEYPFLSAIEKVRLTSETGAPPFNGVCHCCGKQAAFSTPCTLNVMVERHINDDGGIRPTITGGVKLVAAASEESWRASTFPLLLCSSCQQRFRSDRFWIRIRNISQFLFLNSLLVSFLYFVYYNAELVATLSGIIWLVGAVAWAARFRDTKKIDSNLAKWLGGIRWVPETLDGEDEFTLRVGSSSPYHASP
jgi:hypothetical protein